ncbi:MAG: Dabb family protein [Mycobacteriales bacterium]
MIRHVVLMKLTDPADAPEAKARLEALQGQIPALLSLEVGLDVLRTEASYDLCLITTHDSAQALDDYQLHPVHQEFRAWVGPRLAGRAVVDSESPPA